MFVEESNAKDNHGLTDFNSIVLVATLANILIMVAAWHQVFNFQLDPPKTWFQRSGALIIIISAIAEYKIVWLIRAPTKRLLSESFIANELKKPENVRFQSEVEFYNAFAERLPQIGQFVISTWLVLATIIWAYGDLIYVFFH